MALKDLIADRSKLTEAAIEDIIGDYIRYDPNTYDVVLTPAGFSLSNDCKVLAVLVGISGWQYIVDEVRRVDTKPAALEQMTGISGGTLRPTLKKLKDAHLVVSTDDGYSIRIANLDAIGRLIAGEKLVAKGRARKPKRTAGDATESEASSFDEGDNFNRRKKASVPIRNSLIELVNLGFFSEQRTLGQVVLRLHEMAIIAKTTSLSGPIAQMVRTGKLSRKKITEGGKEVWSYRRA